MRIDHTGFQNECIINEETRGEDTGLFVGGLL